MVQAMSGSTCKGETSVPRFLRLFIAVLLLPGIAAMLSGCTQSKTLISVGAIAFTDANGNSLPAPTSLVAGGTAYAEVTLTGDSALLGADWAVYCGSALPPGTPLPPGTTEDTSCGTFTPVHTASGPVPSYATSGAGIVTLYTAPAAPPKQGVVTLYAAATGDHSRYASYTVPVVGIPITIQFGSVVPASIPVNGTVQLKAVLANDYVAGGASWSVSCGVSSCGTFNPSKTASGVATTYQAPASAPPGGNVVITATSVTDSTKSVSATVAIAPISVAVDAVSPTVVVGDTDLITATVANDVSNEGVDWTLSCGSAGACGSITSHTASGVAATFTAPGAVPTGTTVTVQAASTAAAAANQSALGSVVLTITASAGGGIVKAGAQPVRGAAVSLYAAGKLGNGSPATLLAPLDGGNVVTDEDGRFRIDFSSACNSPSPLLYLVARGGNAGGGENPNLVSIMPLGRCGSSLGSQTVTINEVTTVASAYALGAFMRDPAHLGSSPANAAGLEAAMATVR
jgi:hypothetical protein